MNVLLKAIHFFIVLIICFNFTISQAYQQSTNNSLIGSCIKSKDNDITNKNTKKIISCYKNITKPGNPFNEIDIPLQCRDLDSAFHPIRYIYSREAINGPASLNQIISNEEGFIRYDFNQDKRDDFIFIERDLNDSLMLTTCMSSKSEWKREQVEKLFGEFKTDPWVRFSSVHFKKGHLSIYDKSIAHNDGGEVTIQTFKYSQSKDGFYLVSQETSRYSGQNAFPDEQTIRDYEKESIFYKRDCGVYPCRSGQLTQNMLAIEAYIFTNIPLTKGKNKLLKKIPKKNMTPIKMSKLVLRKMSKKQRKYLQKKYPNAVEPEMVKIEKGSLQLECTDEIQSCKSDSEPHKVEINTFYIGKYEVTYTEWYACVAAGSCTYYPFDNFQHADQRALMLVSWNNVQQYINWLNKTTGKMYRLPTGDEWEYATRAGTTTPYFWGRNIDKANEYTWNITNANYDTFSLDIRQKVGEKKPNSFGLFDVLGNASEWVQACSSGTNNYQTYRGGNWADKIENLIVSSRHSAKPDDHSLYVGFRLARDK